MRAIDSWCFQVGFLYSALDNTPPPGRSVRRTRWVLWEAGSRRYGVLQAAPTMSALLPSWIPVSVLSSGRCCTSENRAFATVLPGLDLFFERWLDGWVRLNCVVGG